MFHLNAIFIEQFASVLLKKLQNTNIITCYSSSKDDWFLEWEGGIFQIRFYQKNPFFLFPDSDRFLKRNRLLFGRGIKGLRMLDVIVYKCERCFALKLENDFTLLFKLFGAMSDILLFEGDDCLQSFRKQHQELNDKLSDFKFQSNERTISDASNWDEFRKMLPWFPIELKYFVIELGFPTPWTAQDWLQFAEDKVSKGPFFVWNSNGEWRISLKAASGSDSFEDISSAVDFFSKNYLSTHSFQNQKEQQINEKNRYLKLLVAKLKQKESELNKAIKRLSYSQQADILMANLSSVTKGVREIELLDFYHNTPVVLTLKPELNLQQNAAILYRKSKNEHIARVKLQETVVALKKQISEVERAVELLRTAENLSDLKMEKEPKSRSNNLKPAQQAEKTKGRRFEKEGFEILVGRNAFENDELLQMASKNDIWLHARGVKGSHVIIRCKRQNPPDYIIEFAASLAAHFSEARGNKLAPVIFVERKFVRKSKKLATGQVMVEREKVVMVKPWVKG
jgi:hypothetical protein